MSKLTPQEIKDRNKEIVKKLSRGISGSQLARDYGVSASLISKIKSDNFSSEKPVAEKAKKEAKPTKAAKAKVEKPAKAAKPAKEKVAKPAKVVKTAQDLAREYKIKIVSPSRGTTTVTKTKEMLTFKDALKGYDVGSNTNINVNTDSKNRTTSDTLPEFLSGQDMLVITLSTAKARGSK